MKHYIVVKDIYHYGEYSDTYALKVFTNKNKAEKYKDEKQANFKKSKAEEVVCRVLEEEE